MEVRFSSVMSALRKERGLSQRKAAAELHISQALLSHYENGTREPGLDFLCRACEYYDVSADCLLGRAEREAETRQLREEARELVEALGALAQRAAALLAALPEQEEQGRADRPAPARRPL